MDDNNSKSYNLPLQTVSKRAVSLKINKESPQQIIVLQSKSPAKSGNLANRLIQKRKSVDRKIEEMRKQKIEAEMKEVRAKPKISAKSRVLAVRAEQKYFESVKKSEKPQKEVKRYCDDEINELEEDIQLIEACLNMDKPKEKEVKYQSFPGKIAPSYHFSTVDCISHRGKDINEQKIIEKKTKALSKSPIIKSSEKVKRTITKEGTINTINHTPQRRFIKKKSNKEIKHRSSSMTNLTEIHFAYRSLSPYQVSIKRNVENN